MINVRGAALASLQGPYTPHIFKNQLILVLPFYFKIVSSLYSFEFSTCLF